MPRFRPRTFVVPLLLTLLAACGGNAPGGAGQESAAGEDGIPAWIPAYPGSEMELVYSRPTDEGVEGAVNVATDDGPRDVVIFYRDQLEEAEFEVDLAPYDTEYGRGAILNAHSVGETEGFFATITPADDGGTGVVINYAEAK